MGFPVVGRMPVSFAIVSGRTPYVPVPVLVVPGTPRLLEPLVLVAGMVEYHVQDELHAAVVEFVPQRIYLLQAAVALVDLAVVADIIALAVDCQQRVVGPVAEGGRGPRAEALGMPGRKSQ